MKNLFFIALVSGLTLVACKGGGKSEEAEKKMQDSLAKVHQDSLLKASSQMHQKDSATATKPDTTKK